MKYITAIIMTTLLPATALAGPYYCNAPFFNRGGGVMWLITLVLSGLIIYLLYKNITGSGRNINEDSPDVISILNRRLAEGEISENEYDRLMSRISG